MRPLRPKYTRYFQIGQSAFGQQDSQYQNLLVPPLRVGVLNVGMGGLGIPTITNYQGMIALRSLVGLIVEDDPLNFLYGLPNGLQ